MAILTPLSLAEARAIGEAFGLEVTAVHGIAAGSVNSNFRLELDRAGAGGASGARVFCRVYEEQTPETAQREADLLAHLAAAGVATPTPLRRVDGEGFIARLGPRPVAVFPWCDGTIRCQATVTASDATRVGEVLARIHEAGRSFEARPNAEPLAESRFTPSTLLARLDGLPASLDSDVAVAAARARHLLEAWDPRGEAAGPSGLIHGDLFRDNVVWSGPEIGAVLDFESASRGSQAFDLMVTLLAWCFGDTLDEALAGAMLRGYRAARDAGGIDASVLYAQGRLAAARFTVTRITDFELRLQGAARAVGVYKDFRRFSSRWDALEALGPGGVERLRGGRSS